MNDLKYSVRGLLRTPAFTLLVVIILALGTGANTAIFSVVDAAMFKPMPIPEAGRVVRISGRHPQAFVWFNPLGFQTELLFNQTTSFETVGAYATGELSLSGPRGGRVRAAAVTPEFFQVMKVAPAVGRAFTLDDLHHSFHVVVISHRLWQSRLGGAADVLGRQIVLDREAFVVLGVMPADFELPDAAEVWVPARWARPVVQTTIVAPVVAARLRRGVTLQEAHEDVTRAGRTSPGGGSPSLHCATRSSARRDG